MKDEKKSDDKHINDYLDGNSDLSSIYSKGDNSASPKHLDKLIKNLARDEATPQDTFRNKHNNWYIPASIAAMLLISLFIIIKPQHNPQHNDTKEQVAATDATKNNQELSTVQRETNSKQTLQQVKVKPLVTKNTPEKMATKTKEFELPSELQQLLQNTNASTPNQLPPDEILKTWSQVQWQKQIQNLQMEKKDELATKYIKKFYYFNPDKKLILSNNTK